ncbi:CatA-like O-acetyltransferase [Streptomyces sp. NPDC058382]|uniref:CatA-like O-acetyltransferase n=1 Tax=unclassified Streptomyces TaxID=2593676 RepID=UPI00362E4A57
MGGGTAGIAAVPGRPCGLLVGTGVRSGRGDDPPDRTAAPGVRHDHLAPVFTLGRYVEREGRALLPLAVQIHHAAADGFHTARPVDEPEALMADPSWVDRAASAA